MYKKGDYIVCGWKDEDGHLTASEKECEWISIFKGYVDDDAACGDEAHFEYVTMYTKGEFKGTLEIDEKTLCASQTYIRFATEEEKRLLDDELARKGYYFDDYSLVVKDMYDRYSGIELVDIIARCSKILNNRLNDAQNS